MPELSRFFGIVIYMYFDDHNPPHFHARYGPDEALVRISNYEVISGSLSRRALALVREWAELHQQELEFAWESAKAQQDPGHIEPLK